MYYKWEYTSEESKVTKQLESLKCVINKQKKMEKKLLKLDLISDIKLILGTIKELIESMTVLIHYISILIINICKGFELLEITENYMESYKGIKTISDIKKSVSFYCEYLDIRIIYVILIFLSPILMILVFVEKIITILIIYFMYPIYLILYILNKHNCR